MTEAKLNVCNRETNVNFMNANNQPVQLTSIRTISMRSGVDHMTVRKLLKKHKVYPDAVLPSPDGSNKHPVACFYEQRATGLTGILSQWKEQREVRKNAAYYFDQFATRQGKLMWILPEVVAASEAGLLESPLEPKAH